MITKKKSKELAKLSRPLGILLSEAFSYANEHPIDLKKMRSKYKEAAKEALKLAFVARDFGHENWHQDYFAAISYSIKARDFRKAFSLILNIKKEIPQQIANELDEILWMDALNVAVRKEINERKKDFKPQAKVLEMI